MPTYDYKCTACGHAYEQFQSMKDKPLRKCPKCGKAALERLIGTGGAVIFKGSGFYQTDYRSESYKQAQKADAAPAASTDSGPAKADPKPEPKSDTAKAEPAKSEPASKPDPKPKKKKAS